MMSIKMYIVEQDDASPECPSEGLSWRVRLMIGQKILSPGHREGEQKCQWTCSPYCAQDGHKQGPGLSTDVVRVSKLTVRGDRTYCEVRARGFKDFKDSSQTWK